MVYDTGRTNPVPTRTSHPAGEFGCIGERTCNSCGAVVGDSICMCVGIFTCPRCGIENNQSFLGSLAPMPEFDNIYIGLGISNPPPDDKVIPCFNCKQPTEKTVLKDQVWQCKSGGIVHSVLVPELIVNMCAACGEHSIGGDGDEQITEALRVHTSQPCGC